MVEDYQELKRKRKQEKKNEINIVDISNLETSNFFEDPDGRIDHLNGDGNVNYK